MYHNSIADCCSSVLSREYSRHRNLGRGRGQDLEVKILIERGGKTLKTALILTGNSTPERARQKLHNMHLLDHRTSIMYNSYKTHERNRVTGTITTSISITCLLVH